VTTLLLGEFHCRWVVRVSLGGLVRQYRPRELNQPCQDFTTYQDGQTALALHVVQTSVT
jgi:hypothetical protein